jgi:hypothetical protein
MAQNLKRAEILASSPSSSRSSEENTVPLAIPQSVPPKPTPRLAFRWPDGVQDNHDLPLTGELTIGNIVIRRARVCYYLEQIDNAFPAYLNGQSIRGARTLNDGDVLQIDELQTVFQLAA